MSGASSLQELQPPASQPTGRCAPHQSPHYSTDCTQLKIASGEEGDETESCASEQDQSLLPQNAAGREPKAGRFGWTSPRRWLCLGDKELLLNARAVALVTALTPQALHAPGPAPGTGLIVATLEARTPWPLGTSQPRI